MTHKHDGASPQTVLNSSRQAKLTNTQAEASHAHGAFDLEREGLEGAFVRFSPYVAAIGMSLLGRDEELDDLVQEVFLKAHKHLDQLRQPELIKPWLAQITVNTAKRMLYRRRIVRFVGLDDYEGYAQLQSVGADPEQSAQLAQMYTILDKAAVADHLAWTLRHVHGERLQRVADLCGCSLATAKRRIAAVELLFTQELNRE